MLVKLVFLKKPCERKAIHIDIYEFSLLNLVKMLHLGMLPFLVPISLWVMDDYVLFCYIILKVHLGTTIDVTIRHKEATLINCWDGQKYVKLATDMLSLGLVSILLVFLFQQQRIRQTEQWLR